MKGKRSWSNMVIQAIDWEGIEGMMRKANPIQRIRLLQLLHN
jgi:hypothetical protein